MKAVSGLKHVGIHRSVKGELIHLGISIVEYWHNCFMTGDKDYSSWVWHSRSWGMVAELYGEGSL